MSDNFNNVFQYLRKEDINIDRKEFLFQVQAHPSYPSILAITDTLSFFNIDNGVFNVAFDKIELLPDRFLVILNEKINDTHIYFAEIRKGKIFVMRNDKAQLISKQDLKSKWGNFVLCAEKTADSITTQKSKNLLFWLFPLLFILLFFTLFIIEGKSHIYGLFLLLPIFGALFSIAAFKDLLGSKNEIINAFCNFSASTSCKTIMDSKKWKIFEIVNLSDLSIVFFSYQIVTFSIALVSNSVGDFIYVQKILLLLTTPIIGFSFYYQKIVEKKWCPICLAIITIILLELITITILFDTINISFKNILISGIIFTGFSVIWLFLKPVLINSKELNESQFEGTRFMKNYQIFKTVLISGAKITLPQASIALGNISSKKVLTIITNPFCAPCKEVDEIMSTILKDHHAEIRVNIIINADIDTAGEENQPLLRLLLAIFLQKGETAYLEAMHEWHEKQNIEQWTKKYAIDYDTVLIDSIYKEHKDWCIDNNYNATPAIFINGYKYPKTYPRKNLQFFINDIIDDDFIIEEIVNFDLKKEPIVY